MGLSQASPHTKGLFHPCRLALTAWEGRAEGTFLQFLDFFGGSHLPLHPLGGISVGWQSHGRTLSGAPPHSHLFAFCSHGLQGSVGPRPPLGVRSAMSFVFTLEFQNLNIWALGALVPLGQPSSETEAVMARCHPWESHHATETRGNLSTYCPHTGTHTASSAKTER